MRFASHRHRRIWRVCTAVVLTATVLAIAGCRGDRLVKRWPGPQGDDAAALMIHIDRPLRPSFAEYSPSLFIGSKAGQGLPTPNTGLPIGQVTGDPRMSGWLATGSPPVVAFLAPLTGPNAEIGTAMLDAALLATSEMAAPEFELRPYDTRGTPQGAQFAAQAALRDGARLILGPLFSASARAVAPEARAVGVNVITFSNDRSVAGGGVLTMGFLPQDQIRHVLSFAIDQGYRRLAALAPRNDFGAAVVQAMRATLEGPLAYSGATLERVAFYDPQAGDVSPVVRNLADYEARKAALAEQIADLESRPDDPLAQQALRRLQGLETFGDVAFDAVVVAESGDRLRAIAPLLPFFDIDPARVKFLGTALWDEPGLASEPALLGAWYAAPGRVAKQTFADRFKAIYGRDPHRLASLAYDATALAAVLARLGSQTAVAQSGFQQAAVPQVGADFSLGALLNPGGFAGVDGLFRFGPDGLIERGFAIREIRKGGAEEIAPAPEAFTQPYVTLPQLELPPAFPDQSRLDVPPSGQPVQQGAFRPSVPRSN